MFAFYSCASHFLCSTSVVHDGCLSRRALPQCTRSHACTTARMLARADYLGFRIAQYKFEAAKSSDARLSSVQVRTLLACQGVLHKSCSWEPGICWPRCQQPQRPTLALPNLW